MEFVHDLAVWDLDAASQRADSLIAWSRAGVDGLPPELLLDGAIIAKLLSSDREGARYAFQSLLARAQRPASDLRTRLIAADLEGAVGREIP